MKEREEKGEKILRNAIINNEIKPKRYSYMPVENMLHEICSN